MERRELERLSKVRERSPIRNGEVKEEPRPGNKSHKNLKIKNFHNHD